jgi:hypothetical protein
MKGNKTMNQDYVSGKRAQRYRWYKTISTNVVGEAVKFGGVAADATAMKATVDGIIANMDATDAAQSATDAARQLENNAETTGLAQVRAKVRHWKTLTGWAASGSSAVLQVDGTSTPINPTSYQTTLQASLVPGGVRLDFTKKGAEGAAIYLRVGTTANWHKVGMSNHSPFIDHTPLAAAGTPETREYMARGVLNDTEIGVDSQPVIITFPG